jgi:(E)-4-hydroxy-3-methylbut-2-enyl-diphosphate synthase
MLKRRQSRLVRIGEVPVGGGSPISVQSMTKTQTDDVEGTVAQIRNLEEVGCDIVRCAIPDEAAAVALREIKERVGIPVVADVHFRHELALMALESGADALRINPGNIGGRAHVEKVAAAALERGVPIRVGVNSGSLEKELREQIEGVSEGERRGAVARAMVESARRHISILEELGFNDIIVSLKSSDVLTTVEAYRLIADLYDYPLHIGVTEAGSVLAGAVKSAVGLGILLNEGLGDTIRVSLTGPPEDEVRVGYMILGALGLRRRGPEVISCPTCARCQIDLVSLVEEVERGIAGITEAVKVAVMGCVVNGPGEARDADLGIAGGKGGGVLFRSGKIVRKVEEAKLAQTLIEEVRRMTE